MAEGQESRTPAFPGGCLGLHICTSDKQNSSVAIEVTEMLTLFPPLEYRVWRHFYRPDGPIKAGFVFFYILNNRRRSSDTCIPGIIECSYVLPKPVCCGRLNRRRQCLFSGSVRCPTRPQDHRNSAPFPVSIKPSRRITILVNNVLYLNRSVDSTDCHRCRESYRRI